MSDSNSPPSTQTGAAAATYSIGGKAIFTENDLRQTAPVEEVGAESNATNEGAETATATQATNSPSVPSLSTIASDGETIVSEPPVSISDTHADSNDSIHDDGSDSEWDSDFVKGWNDLESVVKRWNDLESVKFVEGHGNLKSFEKKVHIFGKAAEARLQGEFAYWVGTGAHVFAIQGKLAEDFKARAARRSALSRSSSEETNVPRRRRESDSSGRPTSCDRWSGSEEEVVSTGPGSSSSQADSPNFDGNGIWEDLMRIEDACPLRFEKKHRAFLHQERIQEIVNELKYYILEDPENNYLTSSRASPAHTTVSDAPWGPEFKDSGRRGSMSPAVYSSREGSPARSISFTTPSNPSDSAGRPGSPSPPSPSSPVVSRRSPSVEPRDEAI